jgi:hypothetical protein
MFWVSVDALHSIQLLVTIGNEPQLAVTIPWPKHNLYAEAERVLLSNRPLESDRWDLACKFTHWLKCKLSVADTYKQRRSPLCLHVRVPSVQIFSILGGAWRISGLAWYVSTYLGGSYTRSAYFLTDFPKLKSPALYDTAHVRQGLSCHSYEVR